MKTFDLSLYEPTIDCDFNSVIAGQGKSEYQYDDTSLNKIPLMREWINDNDLQSLTVCSTNIGFVRTFQKRFKQDKKD